MAIPASGALSLADIQTEFGGANPIGLNEYYAGGTYVPSGTSGTYGAVPSSGTISIQNFYGTALTYSAEVLIIAGGGGGGGYIDGGGGAGEAYGSRNPGAGTPNTGGGGGGIWEAAQAGAGGSGIVIIRYLGAQRGSGGTVTSSGGYTIHTFTSSGTYTA